MYVIIVYCSHDDVRPWPWKLSLGKNSFYEFQINVGIKVISHVMKGESEHLDRLQPNQMHQNMFVPYKCKKCNFASISWLIRSITSGQRQRYLSLRKMTLVWFWMDVLASGYREAYWLLLKVMWKYKGPGHMEYRQDRIKQKSRLGFSKCQELISVPKQK